MRLPNTLKRLAFADGFADNLDLDILPSSLQSLTFGTRFNQSLEPEHLPEVWWDLGSFGSAQATSVPPCPSKVSHVEPLVLSSTILLSPSCQDCRASRAWALAMSSAIGPRSFAQSPATFGGKEFNQPMEQVNLPSELQSLVFGDRFNQAVSKVQWPSGLKTLTFGSRFNQQIGSDSAAR